MKNGIFLAAAVLLAGCASLTETLADNKNQRAFKVSPNTHHPQRLTGVFARSPEAHPIARLGQGKNSQLSMIYELRGTVRKRIEQKVRKQTIEKFLKDGLLKNKRDN